MKLSAKNVEMACDDQRKRSGDSKDFSIPVRRTKSKKSVEKREGIFSGISAFFVERGVSGARLQIWKNRFETLGGTVFDPKASPGSLSYVMAMDHRALEGFQVKRFKKKFKDLSFLLYDWLQTCLSEGRLVSTEHYLLDPLKPVAQTLATVVDQHVSLETGEKGTETKLQTQVETTETHVQLTEADTQERPANVVTLKETIVEETEITETVDESKGAAEDEDPEDEALSSEEEENMNLRAKLKRKQKFYGKQDSPNLNEHLTNPLAEMWHIYEDVLGDQWRAVMYRRAVNKLRSLPFKVTNVEQVRAMQGIGSSLLQKMKEILGTGQLQKLEHLKAQVGEIQILGSVWGIGAVQARELYKKGYRTVEDLANEKSLSVMARIGVKYYDDINLRIPREEVAEVEIFVREVVEALAPGAWVNAAGSYRRRKADCGDIDILITHPDGSSHHDLLVRLVQELRRIHFVVDGLHVDENARKDGSQPDMFMGICRLENRPHYRRIDVKVYPRHVYAFALLAFTGNDVLNRKIRFLARVKFGYKLSDQGLFIRESKKKDAKVSKESIPCETEREIFAKLGLDYPEPHERNW